MENEFVLNPDCYCYYSADEELVVYDTKDNRTLLLTGLSATVYDYFCALKINSPVSTATLSSQLQADSIQFAPMSLHQSLDQLLELKLIKHA